MLHALLIRFEKLEQQKRTVLSKAEQLTIKQQQFRTAATECSTLTVLDHLVKVEAGFLQSIRERLPEAVPVRFSDRMGALLVNAVMLSPLKVKVPASAPMVLPEANPDLALIGPAWTRVREEMAD
jgi:uncharacterized protein YcbX